jgi:hypothetical protein
MTKRDKRFDVQVGETYYAWYQDKWKPVVVTKTGSKWVYFVINDPTFGVVVRKAAKNDTPHWRILTHTDVAASFLDVGDRVGISKAAERALSKLDRELSHA